MAVAGGGGGSSSLLGSATTWPLKRYGRFLPPAEGDDEGENTSSWKVFESNEESGHLILTIVVSGHFFISQGRAVLPVLKQDQRVNCKDFTVTLKRLNKTPHPGGQRRPVLETGIQCVQCVWPTLSDANKPNRLTGVHHNGHSVTEDNVQVSAPEGMYQVGWNAAIVAVMIEQEASSHPKNFNIIILGIKPVLHQAGYCWSTALRLLVDLATLNYFCLAIRNHPKEGFSLIDSHKWLRIVRRADCLLLRAHSKLIEPIAQPSVERFCCISQNHKINITITFENECRLFRVQFGGDCKEQMLERCCSCVQKLAEYVPVQVADEQNQQLCHSLHPLANGENQEQDTQQNASVLLMPDEPLPDSCTSLGERRSVTQLAQCVLKQGGELPGAWQRPAWRAQELGPFIRLCLMDQNFPAFVEDVEKELRKLAEG